MLKPNQGYSLIELLLAITLAAILLALALPSFKIFIQSNQRQNLVDTLFATLQFAKSSAISRTEPIIFCPSLNQKTCGGKWRDGQIVVTVSGNLLRVLPAVENQLNLTWKVSLGKKDALEFLPDGTTNGQQGSFCITNKNGSPQKKAVIVNSIGRLRVESSCDGDGGYR